MKGFKDNVNLKVKSRFVLYAFIAIITLFPVLSFSNELLRLGNMIEEPGEWNIRIHIDEEKNEKSYGRMMIIHQIMINDQAVNLSEYATDEWVWFDEYQYLAFKGEKEDLIITSQGQEMNSFELDYYDMEAGGKVEIYLNDKLVSSRDMFYGGEGWNSQAFVTRAKTPLSLGAHLLSIWIALFAFVIVLITSLKTLFSKENFTNRIKVGTFNGLKGLGIILVVLKHSIDALNIQIKSNFNVLSVLLLVLLYALMPMFLIMSGYGFRKENPRICIRKQLTFLLRPYLIFVVFVSVTLVIRAVFWGDLKHNLAYYLIPLAIMNPKETTLFGIDIGNVGPTWFFIALCFGWFFLDIIMQLKNRAGKMLCILLCVVAAYASTVFGVELSFIPLSLYIVPFLYLGYRFKKKKILIETKYYYGVIATISLIVALILAANNGAKVNLHNLEMGSSFIMGTVLALYFGSLIIYVYLTIKNKVNIKGNVIDKVGFRSLTLLYIHSYWYLCFPWDKLLNYLKASNILLVCFLFVVNWLLIVLTYYFKTKVWDRLCKKALKHYKSL